MKGFKVYSPYIFVLIIIFILSLSSLVFADNFEVHKDAAEGYYHIITYDKVKDASGVEHLFNPEGGEIVSKDGLIKWLAREWGNSRDLDEVSDDIKTKILNYIKKVDATKYMPLPAAQKGKTYVVVTRTYGDLIRDPKHSKAMLTSPYVFDNRRVIDIEQGMPLKHFYTFNFYTVMKDVSGEVFLGVDGSDSVCKEDKRNEMADLNKKLNNPLTNYDANNVKEWGKKVADLKRDLKLIDVAEGNITKEAYIKNNIVATTGGSSVETIVQTGAVSYTSSKTYINGNIRNLGNKTIVRLEIAIDYYDNNNKLIGEQTYAMPIDSTPTDTLKAEPSDEILLLEPSNTMDFKFRIFGKQEFAYAKARVTDIVFKDDYRSILLNAKKIWEAASAENNSEYYQSNLDKIDQLLSKLGE